MHKEWVYDLQPVLCKSCNEEELESEQILQIQFNVFVEIALKRAQFDKALCYSNGSLEGACNLESLQG